MLWMLFVGVYSTVYSMGTISENVEDFIYFSMALLVFLLAGNKSFCSRLIEELKNRKNLIRAIILLTYLINLVAVILKNDTYEVTGGFKGYTVISHAIATIFVYEMALMLAYGEKSFIWYVLPLYFISISRARTFLAPATVILFLYVYLNYQKKTKRYIIYIIAIAAFVIVFPHTSMYAKFIATSQGNYYGGIMNSRDIFWKADINDYISEYSIIEKILGKGFSWVRTINQRVTGGRIWAHNDFINVLLSVGIVGEFIYFGLFWGILSKIDIKLNKYLLLVYALLPAFFNGLYDYFPLVLSFVFIAHLDQKEYRKNKNE